MMLTVVMMRMMMMAVGGSSRLLVVAERPDTTERCRNTKKKTQSRLHQNTESFRFVSFCFVRWTEYGLIPHAAIFLSRSGAPLFSPTYSLDMDMAHLDSGKFVSLAMSLHLHHLVALGQCSGAYQCNEWNFPLRLSIYHNSVSLLAGILQYSRLCSSVCVMKWMRAGQPFATFSYCWLRRTWATAIYHLIFCLSEKNYILWRRCYRTSNLQPPTHSHHTHKTCSYSYESFDSTASCCASP